MNRVNTKINIKLWDIGLVSSNFVCVTPKFGINYVGLFKNFSTKASVCNALNDAVNNHTIDIGVEDLDSQSEQKLRNGLNELQKYYKTYPYSISNTKNVFPWLVDSKGEILNYNKDIRLFEGVKLISNFLEKKI